ncbi:peptidoglycan-binding domain-containing protein [Tardiphaga robiniae]|uniref:Peptidoglycan binding-like domain-containing protein n=1 Tax=Tardiphaga robiniae TaxID=943830 RepID=A0A163Y6M8_9BRAD|nr:peptidoglycan-binding domain-containing protein [Tardiphaga robiniae]KZD21873.1 hypothetical protein A4A58_12215 [Tardiphaga robiniae]
MLAYLNALLAYFGLLTPRARAYDVALEMLDHLHRSTARLKDPDTTASDDDPSGSKERTTELLLRSEQIRALGAFIAKHHLLSREDGSFRALDDLIARILLGQSDDDEIASVLRNLAPLLELHRAVLAGRMRPVAAQPAHAANLPPYPPDDGPDTPRPLPPDDSALLWKTTEKLYNSWPVKLVYAVLVFAVLFAAGGTLLIGGQSIQFRKSIEDTGNREKADIEQSAKTVREGIKTKSEDLFGNIDRQRTDINQRLKEANTQINDLMNRSETIKEEAVNRVFQSIRKNFAGLEQKLEADLRKVQDDNLQPLRTRAEQLRRDVDNLLDKVREDEKVIAGAGPAIRELAGLTQKVDEAKTHTDAIGKARQSADDILRRITANQQAAEGADKRVQDLLRDVDSRLKPQIDKTYENEGKLGSVERGIDALTVRIDRAGLNDARVQKILGDAGRASDRLDESERRVKDLEKRIGLIPPDTGPKQPILTEKDLDLEGWRKIQQALAARGFYTKKIDGKVGRGTRDAIGKYQSARLVPATTFLTPEHIAELLGPTTTSQR